MLTRVFGCGYPYQIVGIFNGQVCCFQLYINILNNNSKSWRLNILNGQDSYFKFFDS